METWKRHKLLTLKHFISIGQRAHNFGCFNNIEQIGIWRCSWQFYRENNVSRMYTHTQKSLFIAYKQIYTHAGELVSDASWEMVINFTLSKNHLTNTFISGNSKIIRLKRPLITYKWSSTFPFLITLFNKSFEI